MALNMPSNSIKQSNSFTQGQASSSYHPHLHRSASIPNYLQSINSAMRTFTIRAPFSYSLSLGTSLSGGLSFSYPRRAKSEPAPSTVSRSIITPARLSPTLEGVIGQAEDAYMSSDDDGRSSRCASLAPTDIQNPDPEDLRAAAEAQGIKIRDYATDYSEVRATEIFDPDRGLALFDYRIADNPRTYNIPGKILSRLVKIGWVSDAEVADQCAPMDLEDLKRHNSRPEYPWKCLPLKTKPTREQRDKIVALDPCHYREIDKKRRKAAEDEEIRQQEDIEGEIAFKEMRKLQGERNQDWVEQQSRRKRAPDGSAVASDPKRQRLSPDTEDRYHNHTPVPPKQFQVPLSSGNYGQNSAAGFPDGAQSRRRPSPPKRSDTPPMDVQDDPPQTGNRLQRSGISRTQTFALLY